MLKITSSEYHRGNLVTVVVFMHPQCVLPDHIYVSSNASFRYKLHGISSGLVLVCTSFEFNLIADTVACVNITDIIIPVK